MPSAVDSDVCQPVEVRIGNTVRIDDHSLRSNVELAVGVDEDLHVEGATSVLISHDTACRYGLCQRKRQPLAYGGHAAFASCRIDIANRSQTLIRVLSRVPRSKGSN